VREDTSSDTARPFRYAQPLRPLSSFLTLTAQPPNALTAFTMCAMQFHVCKKETQLYSRNVKRLDFVVFSNEIILQRLTAYMQANTDTDNYFNI
jgi:hypothetical protein